MAIAFRICSESEVMKSIYHIMMFTFGAFQGCQRPFIHEQANWMAWISMSGYILSFGMIEQEIESSWLYSLEALFFIFAPLSCIYHFINPKQKYNGSTNDIMLN